jgi:hypothetical protein
MAMIVTTLLSAAISAHRSNLNETRSLREQRRALVLRNELFMNGDGDWELVDGGRVVNREGGALSVGFVFGDDADAFSVNYDLMPVIANTNNDDFIEDFDEMGLQINGLDRTREGQRRQSRFPAIEVSFSDNTTGQIPGHLSFQIGAPVRGDGFPDFPHFSWGNELSTHVTEIGSSPNFNVHITEDGVRAGSARPLTITPGGEEANDLPVAWRSGYPVGAPPYNYFANILEVRVTGGVRTEDAFVLINIAIDSLPTIAGVVVMENEWDNDNSSIAVRETTVNGNPVVQIRMERTGAGGSWFFEPFQIAVLTMNAPIFDISRWLNLRDLCDCGRIVPNNHAPCANGTCTNPS